jgi:restriction system protein
MARGGTFGGRAEWERQQRQDLREAEAARRAREREARETARSQKEQERERKQQYVAERQRSAEVQTAELKHDLMRLEEVLRQSLRRTPLSFHDLRAQTVVPTFDPGPLAVPGIPPVWENYAPEVPRGIDRLFGGSARYERQLQDAQRAFGEDFAKHEEREKARLQALVAAEARHVRREREAKAEAVEYNLRLDRARSAFSEGDVEAIEWFVGRILDASRYPNGFTRQYQVAYRPQNRDLVVEFELPPQQVVPSVREYRYVKTRDEIVPVPRPAADVRQRYSQLIASVALRTLHVIFSATPSTLVEAVVFNGRVSATDRATGRKVRPHLLSVEAERPAFSELVLAEVDPTACLKRLNALVSPNPFDMEAVEPFIAFDLKRFRFMDNIEVLAELDSRRNLLKLSPTEFEHLVRELFVAMGAEAWNTIPSKDGGVDTVATSKNLFFGGVCLIQAKRYTGLVGLEAVHALTGVMADHNATTGVLVTTSWFGRASEQFAKRNRVTLINGAELKHLIKEHLGIDVIPGTSAPTRVRASDNTQTGRAG